MLAGMAVLAVHCGAGGTFTGIDRVDHGLSSAFVAGQAGIVAVTGDNVMGILDIREGEAVVHCSVADRAALRDAQVIMGCCLIMSGMAVGTVHSYVITTVSNSVDHHGVCAAMACGAAVMELDPLLGVCAGMAVVTDGGSIKEIMGYHSRWKNHRK